MRQQRVELTYRACTQIEEFRTCVQLQKTIWDFADVDLLPTRLFVVAREIGGQIFAAFEPDDRMVGFVLAIPGIKHGKSYFHSHMLGVLSDYQNLGVGRKLKLMQRDDALQRGVRLIEWTFDPLEVKNAFFNLERLGAIVRRYVPNRYGISSSTLHAGLPTDRLIAEWWVDLPHVEDVLRGNPGNPSPEMKIHVPADIGEVKQVNRGRAAEVQRQLREDFEGAFGSGLIVTGFERSGAYLLSKASTLAGTLSF